MRPFAALVVLLSASAVAAQPAAPGPTRGQRTVLVAGALAGGATLGIALFPAAPLGVATGVYLTGRALGLDASVGDVVVDAGIGTVVGVVVAYGTGYALRQASGSEGSGLGEVFFALGVGVGAIAVTTAFLYDGRAVTVAPAALAAPTGERAAGLSVRVGL